MLAEYLGGKGYDIVVLSRSARNDLAVGNSEQERQTEWPQKETKHTKGTGELQITDSKLQIVQWDGRTLGEWTKEIDGAFAVINLTGRSVNCRYNARNRREILESRVLSTRVVGEAIGRCVNPPAVWLNASTATIYKHSIDMPMDEDAAMAATADAKDEFSVEVAMAWEKALFEANTPGKRKVALRISMVLVDEPGSVFPVLRGLVRRGLGGAQAGGKQYVSWIHAEDFCRAIEWVLAHDEVSGGINVAAPNPITNGEMMGVLRRVCGMRIGLPATRWMMEVGAFFMRTETELMLKSRRVVPGKLLAGGFEFRFPQFEPAARELEMKLRRT